MKQKLLYIELKSAQQDSGLAWIGLATLSKAGRTAASTPAQRQPSCATRRWMR